MILTPEREAMAAALSEVIRETFWTRALALEDDMRDALGLQDYAYLDRLHTIDGSPPVVASKIDP